MPLFKKTKRQQIGSWLELSAIIGKKSADYVRSHDAVSHAKMALAVILDEGYAVTTDGRKVYTTMPMSHKTKQAWEDIQPALIRAFYDV